MLVLNLPFKALMFLTLMRPSLVLFLVLWLKLVKDFLKARCRLALLPFLISCLIWLDLVASLPLIKEDRKSGSAFLLNRSSDLDLSLRSSRSSYFATFRHQLTILSKTDALDEEKWLNMLGTFVKDWFRYESHFVHGRDSLVDILKERGLLSESDAVQPLIGKKS